MLKRCPRIARTALCALSAAALMALVAGGSSATAGTRGAIAAKRKPVVRVFGYGIETQPALGALFPPATYVDTEPLVAEKAFNAGASNTVQLQYTFCDTKGTGAGAVACAKQAASPTACGGERCDVALETSDINDNLSVPLLAKEHIPVVGATTTTSEAEASPDEFAIVIGQTGLQAGLAYVVKTMGARKVGILSDERPGVSTYDAAMAAASKRLGMTVTGTADLPLSASATPNASIATVLSGGANGLIDTAVGNVGAELQYTEQSYPGTRIAMPVFMIAKNFFNGLPNSVVHGVGTDSWIQPVTATKIPGIKMFIAEGGINAATLPYRGSDFATVCWLGMRFIGNVANGISGAVTAKTMLHALQTAKNVNMYGILPPWNASQRGRGGADPASPYNVIVAGKLINNQAVTVADHPGVFINATTGKVAYVDPGFKL